MYREFSTPLSADDIASLNVGDMIYLSKARPVIITYVTCKVKLFFKVSV